MKRDWKDATQSGDCGRVLELLDEGADVDSLDEHGQTALMNAAHRGDLGLVRLLVDHGAGLNHTAKYRLTALMLAVISGHTEIVRVLVEAGANLELKGSEPFGVAPLAYAEEHRLDEIAGILRRHV